MNDKTLLKLSKANSITKQTLFEIMEMSVDFKSFQIQKSYL